MQAAPYVYQVNTKPIAVSVVTILRLVELAHHSLVITGRTQSPAAPLSNREADTSATKPLLSCNNCAFM